jgi:hypothetical protein
LNKYRVEHLETILIKTKNKKNNNSVLIPRHVQRKKLKKNNKRSIKFDLINKKSSIKKKKGVEFLLEKIEKEKEEQKLKKSNFTNLNSVNEKLKKSQLFKKEDEFLIKDKIKKRKSHANINIFRTKLSEKEKTSKILKVKSISEKDSSFFSGQLSSEITSINNKENENVTKNYLSEVISSNDNGSNNFIKQVIELKENNRNNENIDDELYSINSKEDIKEDIKEDSKESKGTSNLKKENERFRRSNSIKSMQSKK